MDANLTDRAIFEISGSDSREFLQGLITNDVQKLGPDEALYAALLTPQGKILFDFFLYQDEAGILVDCASVVAEALRRRLLSYRLRAKIEIAPRDDLLVFATSQRRSDAPRSWHDPRLPLLGWRAVVPRSVVEAGVPSVWTYTAHRLQLGVPEGTDFGQDVMFALDADLEELHAVAFDKGCYVGQELTARMKHRGTVRKKLVPVEAEGIQLPVSGGAVTAGGREIGTLTSVYGTRGFALLRLDRLQQAEGSAIVAAGTPIRVVKPEWLFA
jgi:folate-binding protein YgfZ